MIIREFNTCEIIPPAINVMKILPKEHMGVVWSLLSRLVLNHEEDKPFASQFYNYQGLTLIPKFNLLAIENSISKTIKKKSYFNFFIILGIIVDSLNILSQLSRLSKEYYEGIHQIVIYPELKVLIQHSESCTKYLYILYIKDNIHSYIHK